MENYLKLKILNQITLNYNNIINENNKLSVFFFIFRAQNNLTFFSF